MCILLCVCVLFLVFLCYFFQIFFFQFERIVIDVCFNLFFPSSPSFSPFAWFLLCLCMCWTCAKRIMIFPTEIDPSFLEESNKTNAIIKIDCFGIFSHFCLGPKSIECWMCCCKRNAQIARQLFRDHTKLWNLLRLQFINFWAHKKNIVHSTTVYTGLGPKRIAFIFVLRAQFRLMIDFETNTRTHTHRKRTEWSCFCACMECALNILFYHIKYVEQLLNTRAKNRYDCENFIRCSWQKCT